MFNFHSLGEAHSTDFTNTKVTQHDTLHRIGGSRSLEDVLLQQLIFTMTLPTKPPKVFAKYLSNHTSICRCTKSKVVQRDTLHLAGWSRSLEDVLLKT